MENETLYTIESELLTALQKLVRRAIAVELQELGITLVNQAQQQPKEQAEGQEQLPVRGGYDLSMVTEILDATNNNFDGSLKRLAIKLGKTEIILYNIRSNYRLWKRTGKVSSRKFARLFEQYDAAKNSPDVPTPMEEEKTHTPHSMAPFATVVPEMVDEEAGGVIGYYIDDIKTYLGDWEFAKFEEWYRGKTGGIYNGQMYVFKSDFQDFLGSNSVPDTKERKELARWTIDEVEIALDAKQDEIPEAADLLGRTFDSVKSLRWRYKMFKSGQGQQTLTKGAIKLFEQYEKLKGGEK